MPVLLQEAFMVCRFGLISVCTTVFSAVRKDENSSVDESIAPTPASPYTREYESVVGLNNHASCACADKLLTPQSLGFESCTNTRRGLDIRGLAGLLLSSPKDQ